MPRHIIAPAGSQRTILPEYEAGNPVEKLAEAGSHRSGLRASSANLHSPLVIIISTWDIW